MMPSWDTYKNSPEMSGNTAMTDYISRYNAKNPQRAFKPEVYTPQVRQAAPAVVPAAAPSRVMANAPAVGVQAAAPANESIEDYTKRTNRITGAEPDSYKPAQDSTAPPYRALDPNIALAQGAPASNVAASAPTSTAMDETSARQRVLNRDFTTAKPDGRPDVVYGWAGYGGTGRQLVSVPRDERNGQAYSDARREFYRKHEQDRADAYAGTLQRGQKPSAEGLRAWNKANPFNSDMYERDARAYADAAVAPRPVAFNAPPTALSQAQGVAAGAPADAFNAMRMPDGSLAYARPGGSPTLTTGRSASATMPDGKVERTVFTRPSATPTTDAVTNAGLGLDAFRNMMPGAKLAMTAGAMGAGAANLAKQNPSTLAGAKTVVSPTNNAAPPLSTLDAAKAVAKENAAEEQRKQAAITAEQDASNKGASNAAQAKALTPPGSIRRPRDELDGIPLERLPNANPDGSMPKASEETIRAMTPQGLGQNVNDDPNSPYRLLAAAGSNPAAPMPSTSPVKTQGTAMRSLTPTTSAVKQAATGAFDSAGASDKLSKIGSDLGVETSETSRNSRKGGNPEGIGSNVAFDALYNAGESLQALSDTFAGLDPNLSKDVKAKKRGELLAAKYKPTPGS
jgi:hypothetical protein